ncbi:class I SAM-dependent methyltransferase [Kitasatospora cinereorecta]|uniref:Class I SAM-dependent methyltransferase n=1 Tax=Kitasatospora cinereorecta TaxID=285560 RepID=A0ABW0VE03_9ACTN
MVENERANGREPGQKEAVRLTAVPETALWTLHQRATEARRPGGVLDDPEAVDLADRIDFPFAERFGTSALQSLVQGIRVRCFDREVEDFLTRHPRGTVVNLGDGLETQYWRVDNGRARWISVDLPEASELRARLLPAGPRQELVACSVTDPAWIERVDDSRGLLITAEGLLMYLRPPEVRALLALLAERFPGATLVFDAVPRWFSRLAVEGRLRTHGYQAPPMPWGMDARDRGKLATAHPGVAEIRDVRPERTPGPLGAALALAVRLPVLGGLRPTVTAVRFGSPGNHGLRTAVSTG